MRIPKTFLKKPIEVFCAGAVAVVLIFLSFLSFRIQVNSYIDGDMRSQIDAIQENSLVLITKEMNSLKRLTASVAQIVSQAVLHSDDEIIQTLKDYSDASNVIRALFVTLDGEAYCNYEGYLGKSEDNTYIDDTKLSDIKEPLFSQPFYSEELDEVIFGVVAPASMAGKKGVLISSYNIKEFSKMLENEFIDGAADIGIINSKGEVVCGQNEDEYMINIFDSMKNIRFAVSSVDEMRSNFAAAKSGFSIYYVGDVSRYCSYTPIGLNDWNVIVMVKESSLRGKLANLEQYGFQLTIELVVIMLSLLGVIMAIRIRDQKKTRMILEKAAMMDGLTGIYNRKAIEESIENSLSTDNECVNAALLVIDVDDFKAINDQRGHLLGDAVLKECAERLNNVFGDDGSVGRIGGDEFVVFLRNAKDKRRVKAKVDEIIRDLYVLTDSGEKQMISISVGIAHADAKSTSFLALYQQADAALYRAKQNGKGQLSE